MAPVKIAPFVTTPVESITGTVNQLKATFRSQKTKPLEYRLVQLRKLYWAIVDHEEALEEAFKLDLGKPKFEVYTGEVDWVKNDIVYVTKNLEKWMKDEPVKDLPLTYSLLNAKVRKEPIGTVLVIGAFNYPVNLALGPLIGAIAAGCPGVLKPSELSPNVAVIVTKIVEESLDPKAYAVVNGGVTETTKLLNEKWDKIFYTGGTVVGTIVAKKAAETLTPVLLELGGRNPAIISRNADPRLAARRLVWAKVLNAGQICISQNYIIVDKEILPAFVEQLKLTLKEFFPKGQKASADFGRIVNKRHFQRIKKMLDETKGTILIGGEVDEEENFISTTVVQVKDHNDSMIVDESFGPLMPILAVDNLDEALQIASEVDPTPLGFYPFGNKAETSRMLNEFTSGGASVNDGFFHGAINNIPFGGVGTSGQGAYRGQASFEAFTHRRSVTNTPNWMESLLSVRYPPYDGKLAKMKVTGLKPNFDREGREIKGAGYWLKFLFTLGGSSSRSALLRWAVVILVAVGAKKRADGNSSLPSWVK